MIKPTNQPSVESIETLKSILDTFRGSEVNIGNGTTVWTLKSGYINSQGGFSEERGTYPSAIVILERRAGIAGSQVYRREAHLNQIRLAD